MFPEVRLILYTEATYVETGFMRILLATSASYLPTRGGATWANRAWMEQLSKQGHVCLVADASRDGDGEKNARRSLNGVEIWTNSIGPRGTRELVQVIRRFEPDWVLVSSEDFGQARLKIASAVPGVKVGYLAHTPQFLPFGPESLNPSSAGTAAVCRARAIVVISDFMKGYCEQVLGNTVVKSHPPVYGAGPFMDCSKATRGAVTMINPCKVKGIDIFLALAARHRDLEFMALPGWGTTATDLADLKRARVTVLERVNSIEEVFAETRVLVVPSLWVEGFGLVVMEAMLRGLPVVSSTLGGLVEAKAGTDYALEVNRIQRYRGSRDEALLQLPIVPPQPINAWSLALDSLQDRSTYVAAVRQASTASHLQLANFMSQDLGKVLSEL